MKTTMDIPDPLFRQAKALASAEKRTLRSLVEEGLRIVIGDRQKRGKFRLRDGSVSGKGVQPGIHEGSWEKIRDMIYEGRGA